MKPSNFQPYQITEAQVVSESRDPRPSGGGGAPGGGLSFNEILFILFNHKWKIIILTLIGLTAAGCLYFLKDPLYESRAKLLVHYVIEENDRDGLKSVSTGRDMESALNNEVELITSWDLATGVVESGRIDLEKLLPHSAKPVSTIAASAAVRGGLRVERMKNSHVLWISFQHSDPDIPVPVLRVLVEKYYEKHLSTYRPEGTIFLEKEISKNKDKLKSAEDAIASRMENIASIEDAKITLLARQVKASEELVAAKADLAMQELRVDGLKDATPAAADPPPAVADVQPDGGAMPKNPANSDIENYRSLLAKLATLAGEKTRLGLVHTPQSSTMKVIQDQIDSVERERAKMLELFPSMDAIASRSGAPDTALASADPRLEMARYRQLEARVETLKDELTQVDADLQDLSVRATSIAPYLRTKEAAEIRLRELELSLAQASSIAALKSDMGNTGLPNIKPLQEPSYAVPTAAKWVKKATMALALGGLGLGVGLALLIEMFLDRSVKRPQEFESRLHLPLMLSIPYISPSGRSLQLALPGGEEAEEMTTGSPAERPKRGRGAVGGLSPWDLDHFIRPFSDAIRDRLGYHFQINQMTHKPKLIAVTGFSDGAGTSSLACSLAASFAEADDGKVLYVDLNSAGNSAERNAASGADNGDGRPDSPDDGLGVRKQQENLFIARIGAGNGHGSRIGGGSARQFMPKQLFDLIPKFKASEFDYIIFDMPPLGPTSPTLAMAGFMDKVLMVVDAGKTNRDVIKRGYRELVAGNADVSTVLNKTRENLPSWLQG